ncbi:hypothetical protein DFJ77DRAFT_507832 [Powellomyces hirtus]|nr:hypothetical protein DFJ77DRAFT_507832 [Powellomyces hirtus]
MAAKTLMLTLAILLAGSIHVQAFPEPSICERCCFEMGVLPPICSRIKCACDSFTRTASSDSTHPTTPSPAQATLPPGPPPDICTQCCRLNFPAPLCAAVQCPPCPDPATATLEPATAAPAQATLDAHPPTDVCTECCRVNFQTPQCATVRCLWCPPELTDPASATATATVTAFPAQATVDGDPPLDICTECCRLDFETPQCADIQCLWCPPETDDLVRAAIVADVLRGV